ncbi:oligosaccharide flippase family protein [Microbulbifer magnicolonia]|uniref:oligosaccharide flippase family protein n=1 Tax=Microbulbifer magnicolonia TaxID=3109744 RepID=UPI002B40600A|nr:oligosaccharide flippase family protein [Microbulbifer sp. GG15]
MQDLGAAVTETSSRNRAGWPSPAGLAAGLGALAEGLRGSGTRAASLRGTVLSTAGFGAQKLLQLASNLILTRILFPEAFGLMAIASIFLLGISLFSDLGIHQAIVQKKRGQEELFLNTAWSIKIIRGFAIWLVACAVAWPVSRLYSEAVLFPLICALATTAIVQGFASTAISTLNRQLQFKRVVLLELLQAIIATLITIGLALWLKSVWALAAGAIAGGIIRTILSHVMLPSHRHRFALDRSCAMEIIHFGKWILLATVACFLGSHAQPLLQGYLVSMATLGLLTIATSFVSAIDELADKLLTSVGFPALSRVVREQPERLHITVRQLRVVTNVIGVTAFLMLAMLAGGLIEFLYDPRYLEASVYLSILAVNGAIDFMQGLYQSVQLARGDSRGHFCVMAMMAVSRTLGTVTGFYLAGVNGMLYGLCAGSLASYALSLLLAYRGGFACLKTDFMTLVVIAFFSTAVLG